MKKKVDVLFMPAPLQFKEGDNFIPKGDDTSTPPMGIMYIATYLNSKGYNCKILEIGLKKMSLQETIEYIREVNPLMVGISTMTASTITAVPLAREIKRNLPNIVVGCGGIHVCIDKTFVERYPCFDFGIKGEGEYIMEVLLEKLKRGEKISGLYDGGYVKDIESLPFPDYGLIDFKEHGYPLDKVEKRRPEITISTTRGCPYQCSFCCKSEARTFVRFRSAKNIADEIEKNYKNSVGLYSFADDTMTLKEENVSELCREIIARKLNISWLAMTRANSLNLELAKLMKKSGCRELFIGVESGDSRIRNDVIKKKVSDKSIFDAINICRKVGIRSSIFLMLGFPTEGMKEIEKTVNYPSLSKPDMMGIHLTMPLPGSELYEHAIKEGIIPDDIVDRWISGRLGKDYSCWPKYVPKGLTLEYLENARARALRKFYLSPSFILRLLIYYIRFPSRIKFDKHLYQSGLAILFSGKSKVQYS